MKILEILLPKNIKDKDLSAKTAARIDFLQKRMNTYVDKISDPATSLKGKEFLKAKLKDDYDELKSTLDENTDNEQSAKYEIVDTKTGKVVGKPYNSRSRARARVDRLDNEYGAYRYRVRQVGSTLFSPQLTESVNKIPLTDADFELVKKLMSNPIPALVAPIYIQEIIDDDEFNTMIDEWAETKPAMDVRSHIYEWFKRVMPDQLYRFNDNLPTAQQKEGILSPIHGYDPHMYHGAVDQVSGDAYGSL